MQQKKPNKRVYLVIDGIDYEIFPQGDIDFIWELNENGFYEHQLNSPLIISNHYDDTKQYHSDYDTIKAYEDDIYLDIRVDKLCSDAYSEYWTGYINLLGEWNDIDKLFKAKAKPKNGYNTLLQNIDKQFNIFNINVTQVTTSNDGNDYLHNFYFKSVIEAIIDSILPTYSYESTFFDDATNPVADEANEFIKLTIAQKSDIIDPDTAARKGIFTLEEIINFVRILNVFPYVDDTNLIFRLEHREYFENNLSYSVAKTVDIDLTTLDSGKYILNNNSYKYTNSKLYTKEILNYSEFGRLQFFDGIIGYDLKILDDKTKKYNSGRFTTDLSYIQNSPDNIDADGFVVLANENSPLTVITDDIALNLVSTNYSTESYKCVVTKENEDDPYIRLTSITGSTSDMASVSLSLDNLNGGDLSVGDLFTLSFKMYAPGYTVAPFYIYIGTTPPTALPIDEAAGQLSNINSSANNISDILVNTVNFDIQYTTSGTATLNFLQKTNLTGNIKLSEITLTKTLSKNVANTPFSWSNVMNKYWKNGRVLLNGTLNGEPTVFDTNNYIKEGDKITDVPICCTAFDPYGLVRTNVGDGVIKEAKEDKNGVFDFNLIYQ